MSIIYIRSHSENIYNACKRSDEHRDEPMEKNMYKSRHSTRVRSEKKQLKTFRDRGTMGPAIVTPPEPTEFLRKHTGRPPVPFPDGSGAAQKNCSLHSKRPDVPLRDLVLREQDEKLRHPEKNFIVRNVDGVVNMATKKPARRMVVDARGTLIPLKDGLRPRYIYAQKFGNMPKYIGEMHNGRVEDREGSVGEKENVRYVKSDKILAGLNKNWDELQEQFQRLPLLTDTIQKIIRKKKLEEEIKQLEKDISLVKRHPYICVYMDECN